MTTNTNTQIFQSEQISPFEIFLQNTSQKEATMANVLHLIYNRELSFFYTLRNKPNIKILIIGGGDGELEYILLYTLAYFTKVSNQKLYITFNEPEEHLRKKFELKYRNNPINKTEISFDTNKFENFDMKPNEYDFIFASHCFYYISNWKDCKKDDNTLYKLYTGLLEMGTAVIVLQSEESDHYQFRDNMFRKIYHDYRNEATAEDIIKTLQSIIIYSKIHSKTILSNTNFSSCFHNGSFSPNEEGKLLLEFSMRKSWNEINTKNKDEIGLYLKEHNTLIYGCESLIFRDKAIYVNKA